MPEPLDLRVDLHLREVALFGASLLTGRHGDRRRQGRQQIQQNCPYHASTLSPTIVPLTHHFLGIALPKRFDCVEYELVRLA